MYENDKKNIKRAKNHSEPMPEDDLLDNFFYINNGSEVCDDDDKVRIFNILQRSWIYNDRKPLTCDSCNGISFSIPACFGWISRGQHLFPRAIVNDSSQTYRQPMKLQHIAAASSVRVLKNYNWIILLGVYIAMRYEYICIRTGKEEKRKAYDFSCIVLNYIYKQCCEPLVSPEYFENIEKRPKPFCFKCGLFKKITEINYHICHVAYYLKGTALFTPIVEKPYHFT